MRVCVASCFLSTKIYVLHYHVCHIVHLWLHSPSYRFHSILHLCQPNIILSIGIGIGIGIDSFSLHCHTFACQKPLNVKQLVGRLLISLLMSIFEFRLLHFWINPMHPLIKQFGPFPSHDGHWKIALLAQQSVPLNWIESHSIYKYQYILIEWNLWTSYSSLWILQFLLFWFIFSFLARLVHSWKFHKSQNSIQFNWIPYSRFLLLRTSGWFKIVLNNRLASKSTYFHENISNSNGLFLFRAKVFLCKNTNQNYPNEQRKRKKRNDKIVLMIYELYALLLFIVLKKQKKEVNSFPLVWSKWNWKISLS